MLVLLAVVKVVQGRERGTYYSLGSQSNLYPGRAIYIYISFSDPNFVGFLIEMVKALKQTGCSGDNYLLHWFSHLG